MENPTKGIPYTTVVSKATKEQPLPPEAKKRISLINPKISVGEEKEEWKDNEKGLIIKN